jgi:hypothetical protein
MRRTSQGSRPDFLANADEVLLTSSQVLASTISDGSELTKPDMRVMCARYLARGGEKSAGLAR